MIAASQLTESSDRRSVLVLNRKALATHTRQNNERLQKILTVTPPHTQSP